MKKQISKSLCVGLVGLIAAASLSGCSTKATKTSTANGKTTISFSIWDATPANLKFVDQFEVKYPNIKVNVINIPSANYSQKINAMFASNTAPDVATLWECDIPTIAKAGKLVKLDPYATKSTDFKLNDFIPALQKLTQITGANYGYPWCYASEILYYNKAMFDTAKVAYPNDNWTWTDYENAAKKLTIVKSGKTAQWGTDAIANGLWYSLIGSFGDNVVDSSGKLAIGNGAKQALQFEYNLVNKDKASPTPTATTANTDLFASGQAAMTIRGSWYIGTYKPVPFKWDIAVLPKGTTSYSSMHTGFFTITKQSKNKDAAWTFVNYCLSKEGQTSIEQATNNMSAEKSVANEGAYKQQGTNGPTNWNSLIETGNIAQLGYVLIPAGVTSDLINKFIAGVSGQENINQALKEGLSQANQSLSQ